METLEIQNLAAVTKTIANMQSAYKAEKTATAKYQAFSKKAEQEGYHAIALLYNAVSVAESIHAKNHKSVIEDSGAVIPEIEPVFTVKSTKENLKNDIEGEDYESKIMYPKYQKEAESANNQIAVLSLSYAMRTERKHKLFFEQVLACITTVSLKNLPLVYFVCPDCGNTYESVAPKHCDFSLTPKEAFIVFD